MFILHQFDEGKLAHNIFVQISIKGDLDRQLLYQSLNAFTDQNESFQTAFLVVDGRVQQKIVVLVPFEMPYHDFSGDRECERKIAQLEKKIGRTLVDPVHPPLFRFVLVKAAPQLHYLYMMVHHLIFDGWSIGLMFDSIKQSYSGLLSGIPPSTDQQPIQFLDYAVWQQEKMARNALEEQFVYWQKKLSDLPPPIRFNAVSIDAKDYSQARRIWWHIPLPVIEKAKILAKNENTSLFVILLSAYYLLISKISGQSDLILCTPYANRNAPFLNKIVGYLTNMLALRVHVGQEFPVHDFIKQVDQTCIEAYSHSTYPFGSIIKRMGYAGADGYNPVFQWYFIMQNWNLPGMDFLGISLSQKELGNETTKSFLTMNLEETTEFMECWFEYPVKAFTPEEVYQLADGYNQILVQLIETPLAPIHKISSKEKGLIPKTAYLIGEGNLLIRCAEILISQNWDIRGIISDDTASSRWAKTNHIHCSGPDQGMMELTVGPKADYLFSINNNIIIPDKMLHDRDVRVINFHNSLLPRYAGLFATSWAIINGEKIHGITWHYVTKQIDAGDVCIQKTIDIHPDETAGTLNLKCFELAIEGFRELVEQIKNDRLSGKPQNLENRSYFGKFKRPNHLCLIDFSQTAEEIDRLCRGANLGWQHYNDFALPRLSAGGSLYCITGVQIIDLPATAPPGTILTDDPSGMTVATMQKAVKISRFLTMEGAYIDTQTFLQKHHFSLGDIITPQNQQHETPYTSLNLNRIISEEPYWLKRLIEFMPVAIPLFPVIPAHDNNLAPETYVLELGKTPFFRAMTANDTQSVEGHLLALVMLFLAKLANRYHLALPVHFSGVPAPFIDPYLPIKINFNPERSFHQQVELLMEEIFNQKDRIGFFKDLPLRHPVLHERKSGERFQDSLVAVVVNREKTSGFIPFHHASSHLLIDIPSATITIQNYSEGSNPQTARYLGEHLALFIENLYKSERPIQQINLLTPTEYSNFISDVSLETGKIDDKISVLELFTRQVSRSPQSVSIEYQGESTTYRELDRVSDSIAARLIDRGLKPGERAAILMERSPLLIAGLLGILKAGGAYLPIDALFPKERVKKILENAKVALILVAGKYKTMVDMEPEKIMVINNDILRDQTTAPTNRPGLAPGDPAYIIYTSGSTGLPKGVLVSHGALSCFTQNAIFRYEITAADRILQFASFTFDTAVEEIFTSLCAGASLVLRSEAMIQNVRGFIEFIKTNRLTVIDLPTAYWHQLIVQMAKEGLNFPGSVRLVIIGGEMARTDSTRTWKEHFGSNPKLINTYGPTETTVVATTCRFDEWDGKGTFPIGLPWGQTTACVTDPDFNPVLPGIPGQLLIGGPQLATEYIGDTKLTSGKFIPDPFSLQKNKRLYCTGDLVIQQKEGTLLYLGRIDNQIKIRGFRVEPEEINRIISNSGLVKECFTLLNEQDEVKRLVSYIVPKLQEKELHTKLNAYAGQFLPDYMIPASFVNISSFPLTRHMKIDVSALPAPVFSSIEEDDVGEQSYTKTQKKVIALVKQILKIDRCGLHSDFFRLGGDSLLALAFLSQLQNEFGKEIAITSLYEKPTILDIASTLENKEEPLRVNQGHAPHLNQNQISCLKPGGSKMPLFTVYLDAANRFLPDMFPSDQPVYTFIPQGSDGEQIIYKNVVKIATFHIESMVQLFPVTPVHLVGYSFGGVIAVEMALQMKKRNIPFQSVTIIDTVAPHLWHTLLKSSFRDKIKYFLNDQKRKFYQFMGKKVPISLRNSYILTSWRKALLNYAPATNGKKLSFTLIRSSHSLSEEPQLGWEKWTDFVVDTKIIEGDHHSITRQKEKVAEIADLLKLEIY